MLVSCIFWCYYSKWHSIILQNFSFRCFIALRFHYFYKMSVCMWLNFCRPVITELNGWNCTKFQIYFHLNTKFCWLDFSECCSRWSATVRHFYFLYHFRTKLIVSVPNADYFKPIIFKFKIFIYNSNSNIIFILCICGSMTSSGRREIIHGRKKFQHWYFRKESLKILKLIVEAYYCDN